MCTSDRLFLCPIRIDTFILVHGEWIEYTKWSECSESCGENGTQYRYRACTSRFGGRPCTGDAKEERSCNRIDCSGKNVHNINTLPFDIKLFYLTYYVPFNFINFKFFYFEKGYSGQNLGRTKFVLVGKYVLLFQIKKNARKDVKQKIHVLEYCIAICRVIQTIATNVSMNSYICHLVIASILDSIRDRVLKYYSESKA